jgi:hypothetical protein
MRRQRNRLALLLAAMVAACGPTASSLIGAESPSPATPPITTLYLFVHCLGKWDQPGTREAYTAKWQALLESESTNPAAAVCFLTSGEDSVALADWARTKFSSRCFIDPHANTAEVQSLLVADMERAFNQRGRICEWTPYEMWTSTNARRWSEGLKQDLRDRQLTYDPAHLRIVACGQQWGGCLAKYSAFMSRYLDLQQGAEVRAELSPYAGYPLQATFRERIVLDRHVQMFLFETADGRPMAQFFDGLRGVYEPPHVAIVPLDVTTLRLVSLPPTENQAVQQTPNPLAGATTLVDVGDGCRPVMTSIVAKDLNYAEFRTAMLKTQIAPLAAKHASRNVFVPFGCSDLLCPLGAKPIRSE